MELTEEQVETIRKRIRDSGITRKDLENDLLDHLCCLVEQEMETSSFTLAAERIWGGFQPQGGMHHIQTDIEFMFNDKISTMKKIIFFLSAIGVTIFFVTTFLQGLRLVNQYEWNFMIDLAFITQYIISLFLLPVYWLHHYKVSIQQNHNAPALSQRFMFFTGFLCSEALVNAVFFKLMHLPGGNQLFVATAVLGMVYMPFYMIEKYKLLFSEG
jgi:ribosomal protein S13